MLGFFNKAQSSSLFSSFHPTFFFSYLILFPPFLLSSIFFPSKVTAEISRSELDLIRGLVIPGYCFQQGRLIVVKRCNHACISPSFSLGRKVGIEM